MAAEVDFKQHERHLWSLARKVHRRCHAGGARTVQLNDIFQELALAWCKARDSWQAEHNVPFGAYLITGCWHHINSWVNKEFKEFHIAPFELDREEDPDDSGQRSGIHEAVADPNAVMPDETLVKNDLREFIADPTRWRDMSKAVSERTVQFLRLLDEPPNELFDILEGQRARAQFARSRGMASVTAPTSITAAMVFDLMGCDRSERTRIYSEIRHLSAEISQQ